jgi:uncharacterized protein
LAPPAAATWPEHDETALRHLQRITITPQTPVQAEAFFLPAHAPDTGQRFCIFHPAADNAGRPLARPKGRILYIHPFAEEMNKSRRMAALQARAMAAAGYAVLQIDLLGCGDSSGDFGDASWDAWVRDVVTGCQWLSDRVGADGQTLAEVPLWLWGLRAGCLLAAEAAHQLAEPCHFLFWQAPAAGKLLLQQFLRLKVAGDLASGQSKGVMEQMRQQLAGGKPVEIAGYALASGLANGLERSQLALPEDLSGTRRVEWFEVSTRMATDDSDDSAGFSPVSEKSMALLRSQGFQVCSHLARGPSFWQTTEIEDAPDLIAQTLHALEAKAP